MFIDTIEILENATYAAYDSLTAPVTIDNPPSINSVDIPLMDMAWIAAGRSFSGNLAVPSRAFFAS